jgi:dihydrofolate reductase
MIVATLHDNLIGINGDMPWNCPADMRHFKETTRGHTVVMGRKTYDSIGKPLPNRKNIVITRSGHSRYDKHNNLFIVGSPEEALELCDNQEEVFIIGGEQIYNLFAPNVDRLVHTVINIDHSGLDKENYEVMSYFPLDKIKGRVAEYDVLFFDVGELE